MKHKSNKFIGTFVNEMYAILLGIGIGNVLFRHDIASFTPVEAIMGLFAVLVILRYWWDWTEYINEKVVSSKFEFAIDFLILINLELLFVYFKTPKYLALVFVGLSVLNLIWVVNFVYKNVEYYIKNKRQWYLQKVLAIVIYAANFFVMNYLLYDYQLINGLILIVSYVGVRKICFAELKGVLSYELKPAASCEYELISEINKDNLDPKKNESFIISELSEATIKEKIGDGHQFLVLRFKGENQILGFIELSNAVSKEVLNNTSWNDCVDKSIFVENNEKVKYIERIIVKKEFKGNKIGTALYHKLFENFESYIFYAFVIEKPFKNNISMRFHKKLGFNNVGVFKAENYCGFKNYQSILFLRTPYNDA